MMTPVRTLRHDDLPQVADLHERIFRRGTRNCPAGLRYYEELFWGNPWYDDDLASLVYQGPDGRIDGFLGVIPRRMSMNGRPIRVAVGTQFMVAPEQRSSLAGIALLKGFLSGPQHLSVSDLASDAGRRIWEGLGGITALLYSMHWIRPLRPFRYLMSLVKKHKLLAPLAVTSIPFCRALDAVAVRLPSGPFRRESSQPPYEEMDAGLLLSCLDEISHSYTLWPEYDDRSLKWLLRRLARLKHLGVLQKVVIRSPKKGIRGWYLYYLVPGGVSEVLQIGAKDNSIHEIVEHLFDHAWRHGAVVLAGRIEPRLAHVMSERNCLFRCRQPWTLVHSREPKLLAAVCHGQAFLTRLESEWWMRFPREEGQ